MSSIKKNFILNSINTVSGLIFPLITFPYASRILLADGIGQLQFFNSIINYIVLFTSLGIPLYAVREVARVRNDSKQMSKVSVEILLLHFILSFFGYLIVFILISTVSKIQVDIPLFLLLSTTIAFTAIGANWFYQGIEDFKYITIRSIIVRTLSLIALFIFVKQKNDLIYYAAISVASTVGSNVFNFIRLRKYIKIDPFSIHDLQIWRHLLPALKIFALNLIISLYVNLDSVMLGFLKDETAVGYYAGATKASKILVGLIGSLGAVLLPRLSNLASSKKMDEFKTLSHKSINFILALSLPITIGLIFMASPIIHLFCGHNFEPSIITLQVMAPIVLFIPMSGIYDMQILYALGKEKFSILSVSFGAITNFTLNLCLIPTYSQLGAGIATVIAEFMVTASAIILGHKYVPIQLFSKEKINYYVAAFFIVIALLLLKKFGFHEITYMIVGTSSAVVIYLTYLFVLKDNLFMEMVSTLRNKFIK